MPRGHEAAHAIQVGAGRMSTFLFFAEWFFRFQAILVALFGLAMLFFLVLAAVVEAVQRFKDKKAGRS